MVCQPPERSLLQLGFATAWRGPASSSVSLAQLLIALLCCIFEAVQRAVLTKSGLAMTRGMLQGPYLIPGVVACVAAILLCFVASGRRGGRMRARRGRPWSVAEDDAGQDTAGRAPSVRRPKLFRVASTMQFAPAAVG